MTNIFTKNRKKISLFALVVLAVGAFCAAFSTMLIKSGKTAQAASPYTSFEVVDYLADGFGTTASGVTNNADGSVTIAGSNPITTANAKAIKGYTGTKGSFEFSVDFHRTNFDPAAAAITGTWNTGFVVINAMNDVGADANYYFIFIQQSNAIQLTIMGDNYTGGLYYTDILFSGVGNLVKNSTGAPMNVEIAYTVDANGARAYRFLLNHHVGAMTLTQSMLTSATYYVNGTKNTTVHSGYLDWLFDDSVKKTPGIGAGWTDIKFANPVFTPDITNYAWNSKFNSNSTLFVNDGVNNLNLYTSMMNGSTEVGVGTAYPRIFNNGVANNALYPTSLSTTANFYLKYHAKPVGAYTYAGTWDAPGMLVRTPSYDYHFIFSYTTSNSTELVIIKYAMGGASDSVSLAAKRYFLGTELVGMTNAPYDAQFLFNSASQSYTVVLNGEKFTIYNYGDDESFADLFASDTSKTLGLRQGTYPVLFSNLEYTVDQTAVATKQTAIDALSAGNINVYFNTMFKDNAILQRNKTVRVWGNGGVDGNIVTVTFGEQSKSVTISGSEWEVFLDPMSANKTGQTLTVTQTKPDGTLVNVQTASGVVVGEVFLANGQSNMDFTYEGLTNPNSTYGYYQGYNNTMATDYATYNNYSNIRMFKESWAYSTQTLVDPVVTNDYWNVFTDLNSAVHYSATALAFASNLSNWFGNEIPIGVYLSAVGGSYLEQWLPNEVIAANADKLNPAWDINDPYKYSTEGKEGYVGVDRFMSSFYNGMIHNAAGYTLGGIIFYQGCANADNASQYAKLFEVYAQYYRSIFSAEDEADTNLPIISMQLPQYDDWYGFMEFREMQQNLTETIDNMYVVNMIDLGDNRIINAQDANANTDNNGANNIHPANKWEVGVRAAGVAAKHIYNLTPPTTITEDANVDKKYGMSPKISDVYLTGDTLTIMLDQRVQLTVGKDEKGKDNPIEGFEISRDGSSWQAVTATIKHGTSDSLNIYLQGALVDAQSPKLRYLYGEVFVPLIWYTDGSTTNSNTNITDGLYQKGDYDNYFVYNDYGLPIFPEYSMDITVGSIPDGIREEDDLYYVDNALLTGIHANANGKVYTATEGVYSLYTGDYNGKYYVDGLAYSGERTVDGKLYLYTDGVGTVVNGDYNGKYYTDGVLFTGYRTVDGLLYYYTDGVAELLTGIYNRDLYVDGALFTGIYTNGLYYVNGRLGSGFYEGVLYEDGEKFNGEYTDGKFYQQGVLFTGVSSEGRYYVDGVPSGGIYDGKLYNDDGYLFEGFYTDGLLYVNGVLYSGRWTDGLFYSQGKLESVTFNVDHTIRRDDESAGIKFNVYLTQAQYDYIYGEFKHHFGFLVAPRGAITDEIIANKSYHTLDNDTRINFVFNYRYLTLVTEGEHAGKYLATGSIRNMYLHNLDMLFVCIPYVATPIEGNEELPYVQANTFDYDEAITYNVDSAAVTGGDIALNILNENPEINDVNDILKSYVLKSIYSQIGCYQSEDMHTYYFYETKVGGAALEYSTFSAMMTAHPLGIVLTSEAEGIRIGQEYEIVPNLTVKNAAGGYTTYTASSYDANAEIIMDFAYNLSTNDSSIATVASTTKTVNGKEVQASIVTGVSRGTAEITVAFLTGAFFESSDTKTFTVYADYLSDEYRELTKGYTGKDLVPLNDDDGNSISTGNFQRFMLPAGTIVVLGSGYTASPYHYATWDANAESLSEDTVVGFANTPNVVEYLAGEWNDKVQRWYDITKTDGSAISLEEAKDNFKIYIPVSTLRTISGSYGYGAGAIQLSGDTLTLTPNAWFTDHGFFTVDTTKKTYELHVFATADSGGYDLTLSSTYNKSITHYPSLETDGEDRVFDALIQVPNFADTVSDSGVANSITSDNTGIYITGANKAVRFDNAVMNYRLGSFRFKTTIERVDVDPTGTEVTWSTGGISIMMSSGNRFDFFIQNTVTGMCLLIAKYDSSNNYIGCEKYFQQAQFNGSNTIIGTGVKHTLDMLYVDGTYLIRLLDGSGTQICQFTVTEFNANEWTGATSDGGTDVYVTKNVSSDFTELFNDASARYIGVSTLLKEGTGTAVDTGKIKFSNFSYEAFNNTLVNSSDFLVPVIGKVNAIIAGTKTIITMDSYRSLVNETTSQYVIALPKDASYTLNASQANENGLAAQSGGRTGSTTIAIGSCTFYNAEISMEQSFTDGTATSGGVIKITDSTAGDASTTKYIATYASSQNFRIATNFVDVGFDYTFSREGDHNYQTGGITIAAGGTSYTVFATKTNGSLDVTLYVRRNDGEHITMELTGIGPGVASNGAPGKLELVYIGQTVHVMIDGAIYLELTQSTFKGATTRSFFNGTTKEYGYGDANWFNPFFRYGDYSSGDVQVGISAVDNCTMRFSNVITHTVTALSDLPEFTKSSIIATTTNVIKNQSYDNYGGANAVIMRNYSYGWSGIEATSAWAIDVTMEAVGGFGYTGTWNNGSVIIQAGSEIYSILVVGHGSTAHIQFTYGKENGTLGWGGSEMLATSNFSMTYNTAERMRMKVAFYNSEIHILLDGKHFIFNANSAWKNNYSTDSLLSATTTKKIGLATNYEAMEFTNIHIYNGGEIGNMVANWGGGNFS